MENSVPKSWVQDQRCGMSRGGGKNSGEDDMLVINDLRKSSKKSALFERKGL